MKKILKGLGLGIFSLALSLSLTTSASAALTIGALTVVSDGAYTVTGAVGSAMGFATTTTTGALNLGTAMTTGALTIGATVHTGTTTIASGATTTDALDINAATVTTGNAVDLAVAGLTTGKAIDVSDLDAITTGKALHIDATGITQTTGILAHIDSAGTVMTGAGRLLRVDHTGATTTSGILSEFASAATDETVILRVTASSTLLVGTALDVSVDSMTTGTALDLGSMDALTTGIGVNVESGATAMTGAGRLLRVDQTGATSTSGTIVEFASATTDETKLLQLTNTGADITAQTYLMIGTYTDDGQANADFLLFEDNAGDDKFIIGENGSTTITGAASGTDALTLTAGDLTLTSGHATLTVGDVTLTDGRLVYGTETGGTCSSGLAIDLSAVAKGIITTIGETNTACAISFTNGTAGEFIALSHDYNGTGVVTFADVTGFDAAWTPVASHCTGTDAGLTAANNDHFYISGVMTSATEIMILGCQYFDAA